MLGTIKFEICNLFAKAFREPCFAENCMKTGLTVPMI